MDGRHATAPLGMPLVGDASPEAAGPVKRAGRFARRRCARATGLIAGLTVVVLTLPSAALAQVQPLLIQPELPDDFDRGRNVSVREQPRPGYDPLPIHFGNLQISPQLEIGGGASDNIYATQADRTSSAFLRLAPSLRLSGEFVPLRVKLVAQAELWRFIANGPRNETNWRVEPSAEFTVADDYKISLDLRALQQTESSLLGEVDPDVAVLSQYTNFYGRLRGQYEAGQLRATVAIDYSVFDFDPIELPGGPVLSQAERDRRVVRATAQGEYAVSPSLSTYVQINFSETSYDDALANGSPNRDSTGWRASTGVNFDLSRLVRGAIGLGYTWRRYDSALYRDVSGFSAEAKVEYFPTDLTTLTVALRRRLHDSSIGSSQAYFDNRISARIDHALLRNLILSLEGQYGFQDYVGLDEEADLFALGGEGRYLISKNLSLKVWLQYMDRMRQSSTASRGYREVNGGIALIVQP